jgi:RNA polymerase sigma factor (sigma-70 family)
MPSTIHSFQQVALDVKQIYEQYAPKLRFFLQRQLREKHRVEDILQDIFEALLRYPPTAPLLSTDNYIWAIAWREVNEANRRVSQHRERLANAVRNAGDWAVGQSSLLSPVDMAEYLAFQERARRSLERLTPDEHTALMLQRIGLSYNEIAASMKISAESLRNHLRRSYLALKRSAASAEGE